MDFATLIGMGIAFGAIIVSIFLEGSTPMSVVLPGPMLLVIGGTIGAGLATTTLKDYIRAFAGLGKYVLYKPRDANAAIDTIVGLADKARREGLLALEDAAQDIDDTFLRDGLQSAIDGTDPEDLRAMLEAKMDAKKTSDAVIAKIFTDMGGFAPTIGIIGTVVSLVHVLEQLSEPETLGHLIAAAFVATLWGLLTANLIWLPLAARVKRVSQMETAHMELTMEGLLAIQDGSGPRVVAERLRTLTGEDPKESS